LSSEGAEEHKCWSAAQVLVRGTAGLRLSHLGTALAPVCNDDDMQVLAGCQLLAVVGVEARLLVKHCNIPDRWHR